MPNPYLKNRELTGSKSPANRRRKASIDGADLYRQTAFIQTPLGWMRLVTESEHLVELDFISNSDSVINIEPSHFLKEVTAQLNAYFTGSLRQFDIPLQPRGTDFQRTVWKHLTDIPYGKTISYLELANRVGGPTYTRAVGSANSSNPVAVIIPCHRVIGKDGSLTGYAGGKEKKQWLLGHEKTHVYGIQQLFRPDF